MPEHLKALVVILTLASFTFHFSQKIFSDTLSDQRIKLWRNTWIGVTSIAFLAHNFWLFLLISTFFIKHMMKKERNKMAILLLICFLIPPISETIPGFGILAYLVNLDYLTFLSLLILFPIFMKQNSFKFGKTLPDKFLFLFLTLCLLMQLRDTTFTDALRRGFMMFAIPFLPYYAASRALNSIEDIKESSIALVIASLITGMLGMFEYVKHWLLYRPLAQALNTGWSFGGYMDRGGDLRAMVSLAHPIIYGYAMAVAIGFYCIISPSIKNMNHRKYSMTILIGGLLSSLSRGPWMGAIAMAMSFIATGKNPAKRIVIFFCTVVLVIGLLPSIPGGDKYYNLLPFIGTTQAENVEYRQQLFTNSMIVINQSPFFGSVNYMQTPEMHALVQGEGIVDIVNSYIQLALLYGYIGVGLFIGFFISIIFNIYSAMKKIPNKLSHEYLIGRGLISILVCILITITTVSALMAVPFLYSIVAGMGVAYCRVIKNMKLNNQIT